MASYLYSAKVATRHSSSIFLQDYEHPMVVATYKSKENILKVLPPTEELEKLLEGVG